MKRWALGWTLLLGLLTLQAATAAERPRARELGIAPGTLPPGPHNAITDVPGVTVGHLTLVQGDSVRTGATAILPHGGNLFQQKVPAALVVGNGFGKFVGATQLNELGQLETPILLTNTLNVWEAAAALVEHTLSLPGNQQVRSVNPVVGETNDGYLNAIRRRMLSRDQFLESLSNAEAGPVAEGSVGAGTGTRAFGFKGGIGTASRVLSGSGSDVVVGVLVQTNFGGNLTISGVPVWKEMQPSQLKPSEAAGSRGGSCIIVVATDAPLTSRQLKRLGHRALVGMGRTGAAFSHGSGDYVLSFTTAVSQRIAYRGPRGPEPVQRTPESRLDPLFRAVAEATEEAIYNSLLRATTIQGRDGHRADAVPIERLQEILRKYGR